MTPVSCKAPGRGRLCAPGRPGRNPSVQIRLRAYEAGSTVGQRPTLAAMREAAGIGLERYVLALEYATQTEAAFPFAQVARCSSGTERLFVLVGGIASPRPNSHCDFS